MRMYLADANTVPVNLANLPAVSVPAGEADGLPVGLQLIGPAFGEAAAIRAASAVG
jgi:aspartyl-tRNA(Asn)/glutamyl-tRNA(Gln) amidotransferase subunit A